MSVLKIKDSNGKFIGLPVLRGPKGLKGDKGATGAKGDKGDSYVLTAADKQEIAGILEPTIVTVSDTAPVIVAEDNHMYVCGEVTSLDFTPCSSGICDVRFTSGSTVAVLTLPSTVSMPDGFVVETNRIYELNFLDGLGVYQSWKIST